MMSATRPEKKSGERETLRVHKYQWSFVKDIIPIRLAVTNRAKDK